MNKQRFFFIFLCLILVSSFTLKLLPAAQAREPLNVELMYFEGSGVVNGVQLDWRTATEYNTAAFRMQRANGAAGPFTNIDVWQNGQIISIIPLQNPGFPETGGIYQVYDLDIVTGQTYWYTLVEIEESSHEIALETIAVVAGFVPSPTPTGQVIGGGDTPPPTLTPTATGTGGAAASLTPLPTTPPNNNPNPPATNTPTAPISQPTVSSGTTANTGGINNPPATTISSGGQPIAQITPTSPVGYPGNNDAPTTELANPAPVNSQIETPDAAYPTDQPLENFSTPDESLYPLATNQPGDEAAEGYQGITDFGSPGASGSSETLPLPGHQSNLTSTATRGRVVLWVGFMAGLLIFAAGVFGTILLFTRQRNGPR
ncbi:MAG: hypothetical protein KJ063_08175 [Anaerolineae bacterium]|nr:hypothetical protein [Anaerolineae bacterium]